MKTVRELHLECLLATDVARFQIPHLIVGQSEATNTMRYCQICPTYLLTACRRGRASFQRMRMSSSHVRKAFEKKSLGKKKTKQKPNNIKTLKSEKTQQSHDAENTRVN